MAGGLGGCLAQGNRCVPPLPIARQMGYLLPDFYSDATGSIRLLTEGFSLRRLQLTRLA